MQIFRTRVRNVINACYIFPKNCYVRISSFDTKTEEHPIGYSSVDIRSDATTYSRCSTVAIL